MIYNYEKLTPFKKYIIQNFPYIDADFDSITNYELYAKVVEYLNEVIDSTNNQNEQIESLTNAFNDLQSYVSNYFANLDVQDEINNKLDELVADGTIQELINTRFSYLDAMIQSVASGSPSGVYATIDDLTSDNPDHSKIYLVLSNGHWYYYNISTSSWTSGGVYQGTSVSEDDPTIKKLYNDINTIVDIPPDIFPSTPQWKYGNLVLAGSVSIGGSSNRLLCIPITPSHSYTLYKNIATSRFVMAVVHADDMSEVVNGLSYLVRSPYSTADDSDAPYRTIIAPATGNMLLIWCYSGADSSISWDTVLANLHLYQDYSADLKVNVSYSNLDNEIKKGITIYCGSTRQFTTLKSAVEYAVEYPNSTIYVDNEEFDLIDEFGSSYFENYTYGSIADGGLILKNGVHLIFATGSKVVANYDGNNTDVMYYWSPFVAGEGGFILENCEIEASRVRYCVHDDLGTTITTPEHTKFINCKMYLDNNQNTAREIYECIGGGMPFSGEITIDGCIFETTADTRTQSATISTGGVSYHQNGLPNAQSRLIVTNCVFVGEDDRFGCSTLGTTTKISTVIVSNCLSNSILPTKSNNGEIDNIKMFSFNNVLMN